jgi:hypothetical protein
MAVRDERDFNPDDIYDMFPSGAEAGFGPDEGFNTFVRLNDPSHFSEEARSNPAIREFLEAPFSVYFAQFKSSYRETEYFLHKPHLAMTGRVKGIEGRVDNMPEDPRICTLVMNHENTLAARITRSLLIEDGLDAAQIIHKEKSDS